jgi:hypothetical protein
MPFQKRVPQNQNLCRSPRAPCTARTRKKCVQPCSTPRLRTRAALHDKPREIVRHSLHLLHLHHHFHHHDPNTSISASHDHPSPPSRSITASLVTASLSSTLTVSATANTFRHPLSASSSPTPLATSFFSATLAMMPPLPSPQPPRLHPPHHCLSSTIEPTTASIVSGVHDVLCCATLATILATILATVLVAILAATIRSPQSMSPRSCCVSRGARQPHVYCKCLAYVPGGVPTSHTDRAFAQMPSVGP